MYKLVDIGERIVPMLGTAATNLYYQRIFHEDPLAIQTGDPSATVSVDMAQKLAFIMAKQAEGQEAVNHAEAHSIRDFMQAVTPEEDYIDWLDSLDFGALNEAFPEIIGVYMSQQAPRSKAKNE